VSYVRSIAVADANGGHMTVYEFRDRRFLTKVRRFELDTGEAVEIAEADTFRVVRTGEELLRL
jgi:hypothetical protein